MRWFDHPSHVLSHVLYLFSYVAVTNRYVQSKCTKHILVNNQLDALFHVFIYFICLHVSSITVLIIRRSNCINISSGMISMYKWLLGMPVRREMSCLLTDIAISHLHRLIISDDVLIKFDLLMMSTVMLETCWQMK